MVKIDAIVKNETGLHARPAVKLVNLCKTYQSNIILQSGERSCDAKSIFKLLQCCIKKGETITICAEGEDESEAAKNVAELIDALEG